jgi:hypothetical protein
MLYRRHVAGLDARELGHYQVASLRSQMSTAGAQVAVLAPLW